MLLFQVITSSGNLAQRRGPYPDQQLLAEARQEIDCVIQFLRTRDSIRLPQNEMRIRQELSGSLEGFMMRNPRATREQLLTYAAAEFFTRAVEVANRGRGATSAQRENLLRAEASYFNERYAISIRNPVIERAIAISSRREDPNAMQNAVNEIRDGALVNMRILVGRVAGIRPTPAIATRFVYRVSFDPDPYSQNYTLIEVNQPITDGRSWRSLFERLAKNTPDIRDVVVRRIVSAGPSRGQEYELVGEQRATAATLIIGQLGLRQSDTESHALAIWNDFVTRGDVRLITTRE